MGDYKTLGVAGVVVVRPVIIVCVAMERNVTCATAPKTVHGYRSNLENAAKGVVREFFDSSVGKRIGNEMEVTTMIQSAVLARKQMPGAAPPADHQCGMISGLPFVT